MGSSPSGNTTTVVKNDPPQYPDEVKPYVPKAMGFFGDILDNPPYYPGQRVAPITPMEDEYIEQAGRYFGTRQPYQTGAEDMLAATQRGEYMWDDPYNAPRSQLPAISRGANDVRSFVTGRAPDISMGGAMPSGAQSAYDRSKHPQYEVMDEAKRNAYIEAGSDPILQELMEDVVPGIRDAAQMHGGGATSVRSDIAVNKAITDASGRIADEVLAPLLLQEQQLQQDWAKTMQQLEQARGEGDANRMTQASIAAGDIQSRLQGIKADIFRTQAGALSDVYGTEAGARTTIHGIDTGAETARSDRSLRAYEGERDRQMRGAEMVPAIMGAETLRLENLKGAGAYERSYIQQILDAQRQAWEEPLYRQDRAAASILGAGGAAPGGSTAIQDVTGSSDELGTAMNVISTVAMVAGIAAKMSTASVKADIARMSIEEKDSIIESLMLLDVKQWRYVFDRPGTKRYGPILETMPEHFRFDNMHVDLVSLTGSLILAFQRQEEKLRDLQNQLTQALK